MQSNTRVLFVDQSADMGGAEFSLLSMARQFAGRCLVVVCARGTFFDALKGENVPCHVLEAPPSVLGVRRSGGLGQYIRAASGVFTLARRLARLARGYDVIYANSMKALVFCAIARLFVRRPLVFHMRDILSPAHFGKSRIRLITAITNHFVDLLIANSKATEASYLSAGGKCKTTAIYNGFDAGEFRAKNRAQARSRIRQELSLAEDACVIGVFSRLAHWKGQHVVIGAIRDLPDIHLVLVGKALTPDRDYAEALTEQTKQAGLSDRVHFLGFRRDIAALMTGMDVVVHSSVSPEPFGRVIVEGMLAQVPVIATAAGGALEILEDGRTGYLVPPGDSAALKQKLSDIFADRPAAAEIAGNGRDYAEKHFSPETNIRQINTALDALCGSSAAD